MEDYVLEKRPDFNRDVFPFMKGIILRKLIVGWEEQNCEKVYRSVSQWTHTEDKVSVTYALRSLWIVILPFLLDQNILDPPTFQQQGQWNGFGEEF